MVCIVNAFDCDRENCCVIDNIECNSCKLCIDSDKYCSTLQAIMYDKHNCLQLNANRRLQVIQLVQLTITFLSNASVESVRLKLAQNFNVHHTDIAIIAQDITSTNTQELVNALDATVFTAQENTWNTSFKVHVLFDSNIKVREAFNTLNVLEENGFSDFLNHPSSKPILSITQNNLPYINGTVLFVMYISIILCIISFSINTVLRKNQK